MKAFTPEEAHDHATVSWCWKSLTIREGFEAAVCGTSSETPGTAIATMRRTNPGFKGIRRHRSQGISWFPRRHIESDRTGWERACHNPMDQSGYFTCD